MYLTTLAMVALHGPLGDAYLNPGVAGIAIPFVGFYRPLWTAIAHTIGAGRDAAQWWLLGVSGALVLPPAALLLLRWLGRWWARGSLRRATIPAPRAASN